MGEIQLYQRRELPPSSGPVAKPPMALADRSGQIGLGQTLFATAKPLLQDIIDSQIATDDSNGQLAMHQRFQEYRKWQDDNPDKMADEAQNQTQFKLMFGDTFKNQLMSSAKTPQGKERIGLRWNRGLSVYGGYAQDHAMTLASKQQEQAFDAGNAIDIAEGTPDSLRRILDRVESRRKFNGDAVTELYKKEFTAKHNLATYQKHYEEVSIRANRDYVNGESLILKDPLLRPESKRTLSEVWNHNRLADKRIQERLAQNQADVNKKVVEGYLEGIGGGKPIDPNIIIDVQNSVYDPKDKVKNKAIQQKYIDAIKQEQAQGPPPTDNYKSVNEVTKNVIDSMAGEITPEEAKEKLTSTRFFDRSMTPNTYKALQSLSQKKYSPDLAKALTEGIRYSEAKIGDDKRRFQFNNALISWIDGQIENKKGLTVQQIQEKSVTLASMYRPADVPDIFEVFAPMGKQEITPILTADKELTELEATRLLQEAGGDKDYARQLARERGYRF